MEFVTGQTIFTQRKKEKTNSTLCAAEKVKANLIQLQNSALFHVCHTKI